MQKLQRNRLLVTIGYVALGILAGSYNNMLVVSLMMIILFLSFPLVDKKWYKMDEIDWRASYKAGYYAFLALAFGLMMLLGIQENTNWFELTPLTFQLAGALLLVMAVAIFVSLHWYFMRHPDKL